ncbi:MAG TPA: hypothetical protein PLO37_17925 [Candidatus Hydrogenedentes bacterium]|nr:hypothetical protein [Candidatus Hydrogenedentota bacterium]HPG68729.1 hypothetical protein [Candidatus Hydrogenedentota bacterium]
MRTRAKVGIGLGAGAILVFVVAVAVYFWLTPSYEEEMALEAINNYGPVVQRGGHVKGVSLILDKEEHIAYVQEVDGMSAASKAEHIEKIRQGVIKAEDAPFQAEVLDAQGAVIGRVRGYRVQGFGTIIADCTWFDAGSGR